MRKSSGRAAAHLAGLPMFLRAPRAAGLWLAGVLIGLASVVAFGLSYRGLLEWALHHQWPPAAAVFFPLLIDVLFVVCEVILFVAAIDGDTPWRVRAFAWLALLAFTAISVVGNADHAATRDPLTRGGFALPPLVLAIALGFGLGELKRQAAKYREEPETASAGASAPASLPSLREIQARRSCGQATARKIRAELAAFERGRGDSIHIGAGSAPATSRGRGGARAAGQPPAVPAASVLPAGADAPRSAAPAGAEVHLNGSGPHG